MIRFAVRLDRGEFALNVDCATSSHATGLFGPSGAGKTTLIHLLAGLFRPDRGRITLGDQTLFDAEQGIDVPAHRRRIGVVFQEHRLFPHLSVRGNLVYGAPRGEGDVEFRRIVDLLELGRLLDRRATNISGGEKQRVAIGRALISQPRLLLLDEPMSSLDERLKQQIIPYLQRVRDESSVPMLYVSHDMTELLQMTDQLIVLDRGELVGQGRYHDLVHDQRVLGVFRDGGLRNLLAARVERHVPDDCTSILQLGDGAGTMCRLVVPLCAAPPGARVAVGVPPWDVALAMDEVLRVSIQNQLRGTVRRCTQYGRSVIVEVDVGVPLIAEVSRRSARLLEIAAGRPVVCLIKSHAIRTIEPSGEQERRAD